MNKIPSIRLTCFLAAVALGLIVGCAAPHSASKPQSPGQRGSRPKSLAEARAMASKAKLPISEYDSKLVEAIQRRWFDLLDAQRLSWRDTGKVVVQFRLHTNGSVSHVRVITSNVKPPLDLVCCKAITEVAPFAPWPDSLQRKLDKNYREVIFHFYFEPEQ